MHSNAVSVCKNDEITIKKQNTVAKNALFAFSGELFLRVASGLGVGFLCGAFGLGRNLLCGSLQRLRRGGKSAGDFSRFPGTVFFGKNGQGTRRKTGRCTRFVFGVKTGQNTRRKTGRHTSAFFFGKAARFFAFFFVICYNAVVAELCRMACFRCQGFALLGRRGLPADLS